MRAKVPFENRACMSSAHCLGRPICVFAATEVPLSHMT
jgi:hypothetical protein